MHTVFQASLAHYRRIALACAFTGIFTAPAFATPTAEVLARLNAGYNPVIRFAEFPPAYHWGCNLKAVRIYGQDPLTFQEREIQANVYVPRNRTAPESEMRTILLVPPTGGENALDRLYALHFCNDGFRVLILQRWAGDRDTDLDPSMHDRGTILSQAAVRHAVTYLNPARPSLLGILGTSVGALIASISLGLDERISAGVLIVGGVGIADIIAHSDETTLTQLRNARKEHFHFADDAEYREALAKAVLIDPADFVGLYGDKKVRLMLAEDDTTVPTLNQKAMLSLLPQAESHWFPGDHVDVIKEVALWHKSDLSDFFSKALR